MGRPTGPLVSTVTPLGARQTDTHGHSKTEPLRRNYSLARWKRKRWSILVRDLFTCQMCSHIEHDTSQLVADHKTPHRGDEQLFWDDTNLWTLCKTCHDGPKQSVEKGGKETGAIGYSTDVGPSGMPVDPRHPWNR